MPKRNEDQMVLGVMVGLLAGSPAPDGKDAAKRMWRNAYMIAEAHSETVAELDAEAEAAELAALEAEGA